MTTVSTPPEESGLSFRQVFSSALRVGRCHVVWLDGDSSPLPVNRWRSDADESDRALLAHCVGTTLDVGCGPGRMSEQLMHDGHLVLAVDVVAEAVTQARERGVSALRRDVFKTLPAEGRWETALLADGNIGIAGDPVSLLSRIYELLAPGGLVVADLEPPGTGVRHRWARVQTAGQSSRPFLWSRVAADAVGPLSVAAGFAVTLTAHHDGRWFGVLRKRE